MAKRKGGAPAAGLSSLCDGGGAIRFAVEDFPEIRTLGAWMQIGDERFDGDGYNGSMTAANIREPPPIKLTNW